MKILKAFLSRKRSAVDLSPRTVKVESSDGPDEWAKIYNVDAVVSFLKNNGFKKAHKPYSGGYENDNCVVMINTKNYEVHYESVTGVGIMFSTDLNIYWLIGVLTHHGLIDKNFEPIS